VIVAAYFCRGIADFFRGRLLAAGRPGYDAFCNWLAAGICLVAYFMLIPRFGTWGAAMATLLSCFAMLAIVMVWTYRMRPYRVEAGRLGKLGAVLAATLFLYLTVPITLLPVQIAWAVLLLVMFPGALWLLRFPTAAESDVMRAALQSVANHGYRVLGV
jgi:O-antigen/teichoic acid export membrane protein